MLNKSHVMSFLDITDPKRRDAIVADYLATVKRIQRRNLNEHTEEMTREENVKNLFHPIVKSNERSTKMLTRELLPMQKQLGEIKTKLSGEVGDDGDDKKQITTTMYDRIIEKYDASKIDTYFGIERVDGNNYMMGDKNVSIDSASNILVDGRKFKGTVGLWNIIMLKKPSETSYTFDDVEEYKKLVKQTGVDVHPRCVTDTSRPYHTYKWRNIISSLSSTGDGVHFLPGDIKGLKTKLNLLLAEFAAGNKTSTRNEIVPILDELLRRKRLSHREYTEINNYLSKCL